MERMIKIILAAAILLLPFVAQAQELTDDARIAALVESQAPRPAPQAAEAPPAPVANEDSCDPKPFGQSLFSGSAPKSVNAIMSSKQRVAPGDRISLAIWGAVQSEELTTVDSQGFIYIKGVGPIAVVGKTEEDLSRDIRKEISRVFKDDVEVYARLEQNAGTPVMVTGGVQRPGQYFGSAEDSITTWLLRAGGILAEQGSYRNIQIRHGGGSSESLDLYPFLEAGTIDNVQWQAGDVIVVGTPGIMAAATGNVRRCAVFEFQPGAAVGADLLAISQPEPSATHAMLNGYRDGKPFSQIYSLAAFAAVPLKDGDKVQFYGAPQSQQMTITVEGQTLGNRKLILPLHARLSEALDHIPVNNEISDTSSIFIKRKTVAKMQQDALDESVNRLLQSALTAPAQSDGEALIRAKEAELIENFVARIKDVKQEGRVVVMQGGTLNDLPLEDGDVIVVPEKTNVVSIEGEIVLPRAVVAKMNATARDYVQMAGGYTERGLEDDYIVIKPNGDAIRDKNPRIGAGDRLLVLPRVDAKNMQTVKDIVQILYQVAVGAGVLLRL